MATIHSKKMAAYATRLVIKRFKGNRTAMRRPTAISRRVSTNTKEDSSLANGKALQRM